MGTSWLRRFDIHKSTYCVVALVLSLLLCIVVPGEVVDIGGAFYSGPEGGGFLSWIHYRHGWPWVHLKRTIYGENSALDVPYGENGAFVHPTAQTPWLHFESWLFTRGEVTFNAVTLIANLVVAALLLMATGTLYELWRRRRNKVWQFTLADACFLFLVIAACLAWWSRQRQEAAIERRAVAKIEGAGHFVEPAYCGPKWIGKLVGSQRIETFSRTEAVLFRGFYAEEFKELMPHLQSLKRLRRLEFGDPEFRTSFGAAFDDEGMQYIRCLPHLRELRIRFSAVTDAGLANLGEFSDLELLDLYCTEITDDAVEYLQRLKNLKELRVGATLMTEQGVGRLKTALPGCDVRF